jgi:hypothetical protein
VQQPAIEQIGTITVTERCGPFDTREFSGWRLEGGPFFFAELDAIRGSAHVSCMLDPMYDGITERWPRSAGRPRYTYTVPLMTAPVPPGGAHIAQGSRVYIGPYRFRYIGYCVAHLADLLVIDNPWGRWSLFTWHARNLLRLILTRLILTLYVWGLAEYHLADRDVTWRAVPALRRLASVNWRSWPARIGHKLRSSIPWPGSSWCAPYEGDDRNYWSCTADLGSTRVTRNSRWRWLGYVKALWCVIPNHLIHSPWSRRAIPSGGMFLYPWWLELWNLAPRVAWKNLREGVWWFKDVSLPTTYANLDGRQYRHLDFG